MDFQFNILFDNRCIDFIMRKSFQFLRFTLHRHIAFSNEWYESTLFLYIIFTTRKKLKYPAHNPSPLCTITLYPPSTHLSIYSSPQSTPTPIHSPVLHRTQNPAQKASTLPPPSSIHNHTALAIPNSLALTRSRPPLYRRARPQKRLPCACARLRFTSRRPPEDRSRRRVPQDTCCRWRRQWWCVYVGVEVV